MTLAGATRHSSNDNAVDIDQSELHKECSNFLLWAKKYNGFASLGLYKPEASKNHIQ